MDEIREELLKEGLLLFSIVLYFIRLCCILYAPIQLIFCVLSCYHTKSMFLVLFAEKLILQKYHELENFDDKYINAAINCLDGDYCICPVCKKYDPQNYSVVFYIHLLLSCDCKFAIFPLEGTLGTFYIFDGFMGVLFQGSTFLRVFNFALISLRWFVMKS